MWEIVLQRYSQRIGLGAMRSGLIFFRGCFNVKAFMDVSSVIQITTRSEQRCWEKEAQDEHSIHATATQRKRKTLANCRGLAVGSYHSLRWISVWWHTYRSSGNPFALRHLWERGNVLCGRLQFRPCSVHGLQRNPLPSAARIR